MSLTASLPDPAPDQDKQIIGVLLRRVAQLEAELSASKAQPVFPFQPVTPVTTGCPHCRGTYYPINPTVTWTYGASK